MKNTDKIIFRAMCLVLLSAMFVSCKKFLDKEPSKSSSLVVKTTDQINALLDNRLAFYEEESRPMSYGTDDYGLTTDLYNAGRNLFSPLEGIHFATWDSQYLVNDTRDNLWSKEYKKIFTANLALESLPTVTGSEQDKANIMADAHFIRAYSYWILANTYCLPFTEANKNEPGLPIKNSTRFDEPAARQSLEKTYALIEDDLAQALKTTVSLSSSGKPRHWRASKAGVNGFAARYYLNRNNYSKAIEHADAALADYNILVDYNSEMRYGRENTVYINPGTTKEEEVKIEFPYTHDNQVDQTDILAWKEFLYFRVLSNPSWWYIPSQELLNLYDKVHDLRYQYHVVEHYSYDYGMSNPSYDYPGYIFFFNNWTPSGPTVAEMLLTKAEAQARSNNQSGAMLTLNLLRAKRMTPGPWVNLSASNRDDAIKKILEERRREMPFAQRWFDIRRYNNNDDLNDDVVLTRVFYPYTQTNVLFDAPVKTYTLEKKSRRFASPIPKTEIVASNCIFRRN